METTTDSNKNDILILIIADLRNRKLIMGLEAAGLYSDNFYTSLADVIFAKIGFPDVQDEELFTWYENTVQSVLQTDIHYFKEHHRNMALRIYNLLLEKKYAAYPSRQKQVQKILDWIRWNK